MTIPLWVLLAFAVWTLLVLGNTIGVYRWGHILTGRARFKDYGDYSAYRAESSDFYKRSMRAHANCIENLPIYGAIVVVAVVAGAEGPALDILAVVFMVCRVGQTVVHVAFKQTNVVVAFRSIFYNAQWACMVAMAILVALDAAK